MFLEVKEYEGGIYYGSQFRKRRKKMVKKKS